jgi:hypothetical protein
VRKTTVIDRLCAFLSSPRELQSAIAPYAADTRNQQCMIEQAAKLAQTWHQRSVPDQRRVLSKLVPRIDIGKQQIDLHLKRAELAALMQPDTTRPADGVKTPDLIKLPIVAELQRTGLDQKLIIEG